MSEPTNYQQQISQLKAQLAENREYSEKVIVGLHKELALRDDQIKMLRNDLVDQYDKISRKDQLLRECLGFLHVMELGDQMCCLTCHEGNDGEPEHQENCNLRNILSRIEKELP